MYDSLEVQFQKRSLGYPQSKEETLPSHSGYFPTVFRHRQREREREAGKKAEAEEALNRPTLKWANNARAGRWGAVADQG